MYIYNLLNFEIGGRIQEKNVRVNVIRMSPSKFNFVIVLDSVVIDSDRLTIVAWFYLAEITAIDNGRFFNTRHSRHKLLVVYQDNNTKRYVRGYVWDDTSKRESD